MSYPKMPYPSSFGLKLTTVHRPTKFRMPRFIQSPLRPTNAERKQHQFSRLLRSSPPQLPLQLKLNETTAGGYRSRTFGDMSGKVSIILCVHHSTGTSSGALLTASAALGTIGPVLYPGHPLNLVSPRNDHDSTSGGQTQCVTVDSTRNQITLVDPTPMRRRGGTPVAKLFTFDAVLTNADAMADLCAVTLPEVIQAVLRGQDGCVLTIGHKQTGKTYSMLGSDEFPTSAGVIPCAISWLYSLLDRQQESQGIRYSVRVSAVELSGPKETFHDLLANVAPSFEENCVSWCNFPPTSSTNRNHDVSQQTDLSGAQETNERQQPQQTQQQDDVCASAAVRMERQLSRRCELTATSMERAAYLLDIALANRRQETVAGLSHMLFTLHVYQCRVEQAERGSKVYGKRTKLHLLDLGCGRYNHHNVTASSIAKRTKKNNGSGCIFNDTSSSLQTVPKASPIKSMTLDTKSLSISGMANVLLALLTGQRNLPFRDSALTHLLKEAVTGTQTYPCILAHVASGAQYYTETLQVVQLASKLSRLRRRRVGGIPASGVCKSGINPVDTGSSSVDSFSDHGLSNHRRRFRGPRLGRSSYTRSICSFSSELDFTSSSEQSCDTVIHLGQSHSTGSVHHVVARLGPRGAADGSVDTSSVHSGHWSANEATTNDPIKSALWNITKVSLPSTIKTSLAMTGSVKRMIPRTNASAWPRHLSVRKAKPNLMTLNETWVDGPKVVDQPASAPPVRANSGGSDKVVSTTVVEEIRPSVSLRSLEPHYESSISQSGTRPFVTKLTQNPQEFQHHSRSSPLGGQSCGDQCSPNKSTGFGKSHNEQRSSDTKTVGSTFDWQPSTRQIIPSEESNTSESIGVTREPQRGPRALSDISEHTEDPETGPDCNTIRSDSTDNPVERLSLLNLEGLNSSKWACPERFDDQDNAISTMDHSTANNVTIMNLRNQIWEASVSSVRGSGEGTPNFDRQNNFPHCTKHQTPDTCTNRHPSLQTSTRAVQVCDTSPIRAPSTGYHKAIPKQHENLVNAASLSGCGERTASVASFEQCINSPVHYSASDAAPRKSRTLSSCGNDGYFSGPSSIGTSKPDSTGHGVYPWNKLTKVPHSSPSPHSRLGDSALPCPHNSLLRVAAWVNSIDPPLTYSTPVRSPEISVDCSPRSPLIKKLPNNEYPSNGAAYQASTKSPRSIMYPVPYTTGAYKSNESRHSETTFVNQAQSENSSKPLQSCIVQQAGENRYPEQERRPPWISAFPNIASTEMSSITLDNPALRMTKHSTFPETLYSRFLAWTPNTTEQASIERPHLVNVMQDQSHGVYLPPEHQMLSSENNLHSIRSLSMRSTGTGSKTGSEFIVNSNPPCDVPHCLATSVVHRSNKKTSKNSRGFCFLTLPIFRNLRPRKSNKTKAEERHKLQPSDTTKDTIVYSTPSHNSLTNSPVNRYQCQMVDQVNHTRWFGSTHSHDPTVTTQIQVPMNSSRWCHNPQGSNGNIQVNNYAQVVGHHHGEQPSHAPKWNDGARCLQEPTFELVCPPYTNCGIQHTPNTAQPGVRNCPTAPAGVTNYAASALNNICRSGLRSIIGGPASSGYESMRIGTSELSLLSHHDSASECSGHVGPGHPLAKECAKHAGRGASEGHHHHIRRHSSTTASRISGSAESTASNPSPMHIPSLKSADAIAYSSVVLSQANALEAHVTSFIGSRHQPLPQHNR